MNWNLYSLYTHINIYIHIMILYTDIYIYIHINTYTYIHRVSYIYTSMLYEYIMNHFPPAKTCQGHCIILGCTSGRLQVWDAASAELLTIAKDTDPGDVLRLSCVATDPLSLDSGWTCFGGWILGGF